MRSSSIPVRCVLVGLLLAWGGPVSAMSAEPADLPALEQAWHGCVRDAYDRQPDRSNRAVRDRTALDACRVQENAYVAALMATRPDGGDELLHGWATMLAGYVAFVMDPVAAWIRALRR